MNEVRIEEFVRYWFKGMDHMREVEYFLTYIDDMAEFSVPEGTFRGPEGFRIWYGSLKELVKPYNKHDLLRVEVRPKDERYVVKTDVLVKADTYSGGLLHIRAKETWEVGLTGEEPTIYEYRIDEVEAL